MVQRQVRQVRLTNIFLATMDSLILSGSTVFVSSLTTSPHSWVGWICLLFPLLSVSLVTFFHLGLYNSRRTGSCFSDLRILAKGVLCTVALFPFMKLLNGSYPVNPTFTFLFASLSFLFLSSSRFTLRVVMRHLREHGINTKKIILLGLSPATDLVLEKISSHLFYGYEVIGVFGSSESGHTVGIVLGSVNDFLVNLNHYRPDEVIIALPFEYSSNLHDYVKTCELIGAQAMVTDSLASVLAAPGQALDLDGLRLVNTHSYPTERLDYLVAKRLLDFSLSLVLLVLLSPLFLLISLAIKLSSKGPILFRQRRVGLNGNRFWMLKFRTMTHVEDTVSDIEWVPQSIDRYTPLGMVLRRTNLDELPQLINVLKGEMSLVGPRPERPFYIEQFKKEVPHYMLRHCIKCGMTGWAQVNGWRGNTSILKRTEHDLYYMKHWDFWFDIKILFFTLFRGLYQSEVYDHK